MDKDERYDTEKFESVDVFFAGAVVACCLVELCACLGDFFDMLMGD